MSRIRARVSLLPLISLYNPRFSPEWCVLKRDDQMAIPEALFPEGENAKPARSHGSGRIGRPEKATALGGSSLDRVVPAPPPPARGVKRARVVSAFSPPRDMTPATLEVAFTVYGD